MLLLWGKWRSTLVKCWDMHILCGCATGLDRGSGLVCRRVPRRNPSTTRPGMIWRRPAHRSDCGSVHASSISQAFRKRFVHSFNTANKAREADTFERL